MTPSAFIASLRGEAGVLPSGPRTLRAEAAEDSHRARLVAGMAEAAAE